VAAIWKTDYGRRGSAAQRLALTLPTCSGRSSGIVRTQTQATEFLFVFCLFVIQTCGGEH
jgi:hypothetical protein